jgi:uncharacterized surface protein with fasciclin (FAS1) repeats
MVKISSRRPLAAALAVFTALTCAAGASQAKDKTEQFKEKQGFERKPKDIVNTLQDNEVTAFHTLIDGLDQAFSLDHTLKNRGPWTLLAPSDNAFKKLPDDDKKSLWANKNKLKQVLQYHMISGRYDAKALSMLSSLKTAEGHEVKLSKKGNDLYADGALIRTTDIPCSNGIIHVLDRVIMPPLSK